jgi:hypothetical protein
MPVEIRELIIRAVTSAEPQELSEPSPRPQSSAEEREAIIQECVRQVLRILKKMRER